MRRVVPNIFIKDCDVPRRFPIFQKQDEFSTFFIERFFHNFFLTLYNHKLGHNSCKKIKVWVFSLHVESSAFLINFLILLLLDASFYFLFFFYSTLQLHTNTYLQCVNHKFKTAAVAQEIL